MLYGIMVVVSLGVYAGLVMWSLSQPETGATYLVAAIVLPLIGWYAHGMALGRVRGNAVRVSDKQFPQLYRLTLTHARRLDLKEVPAVYVLQSGGLLNAGKQLHPHVDVREFAAQAEKDQSFWIRRAELMSSHPLLPKRVAALLKAGIAIPTRSQLPVTGNPIAA